MTVEVTMDVMASFTVPVQGFFLALWFAYKFNFVGLWGGRCCKLAVAQQVGGDEEVQGAAVPLAMDAADEKIIETLSGIY